MLRCKVYKDGSHYIAIRPTAGYTGVRRKAPPEEPIIVEEIDKEPTAAENCFPEPDIETESCEHNQESKNDAARLFRQSISITCALCAKKTIGSLSISGAITIAFRRSSRARKISVFTFPSIY